MHELIRPFAIKIKRNMKLMVKNIRPEVFFSHKYFSMLKAETDIRLRQHPHITVEASSICNLNCLCCGTRDSTRSRGFIDVGFFKEVVENVIVPNKQKYITMNTIGETLMHPEFGKLLEILDMNSISLILVTNGLLFLKHTKEMEQYSHVISQIQLSIDGATKETYEKLRRNGKFDVLLKNLDWLKGLNEKVKAKIPMEINAVLSEDNIDEVPLFFRVFSEYVSKENILFWLLCSRMSTQSKGDYFHSNRLLKNVKPAIKSPCSMPYIKSHVLYNGDVGACCRDYHGELIVGNVKDNVFNDIWTGSKYRKLRQMLSENRHKEIPLCRDCYEVPPEITFAVNIFIQYQLTVKGDSCLVNISEALLRFLGDVSDIYNTGNLNESSFKETLLNYRL